MARPPDARQRLLRTAAALFITRSYHGVGVEELCQAADVRRGSFYHHFSSKSDLVAAVIDMHAATILGRFDNLAEADPLDRLRALAEAITNTQVELADRFGRVVGCPFGNLAAELSTTDEDIRRHVAAVLDELEARIAHICTELAIAGRLRPGVDPAELARTIMTQYHGFVLVAKVNNATDIDELGPALHRVIDAGVA